MIAILVPTEDWDAVWHLARPLLEPAFDHGRDYSADDAPPRLARGEWGLWIVVDGSMIAAAITEFLDFPRRRKLWIVAAGGDMRRAVPELWPKLQSAAEDNACYAVAWQGRKGWLRSGVLPGGFKHVADVVEVEL